MASEQLGVVRKKFLSAYIAFLVELRNEKTLIKNTYQKNTYQKTLIKKKK